MTKNTQPAILLISFCFSELLKKRGLKPEATSGHSVGEYGALVASGVISFQEALKAVRRRGEFMQSPLKQQEGSMVAVLKKPLSEVERISKVFELEMANFNSPEQVVLSGKTKQIEKLIDSLEQKEKIYFRVLKVSAPFHSSFMKKAQDNMKPLLEALEFKEAFCPVVQNVTAKEEKNPEKLKQNLISQICAPVLWTDCVRTLYNLKVKEAFETGEGNVLKGLVKKIEPQIKVHSFNSLSEFKEFEREVL